MAVAFDSVGPAGGGGGGGNNISPITWTHTPVGTLSAVYVFLAVGNANTGTSDSTMSGNITSVTYGGTAMTAFSSGQSSGSTGLTGTGGFVKAYFLHNPPTGAQTVSVTFTNTGMDVMVTGSIGVTGSAGEGNLTVGFSSSGTATSGSITISGTSTGNLCISILGTGSGGEAWTTGTQRWLRDQDVNTRCSNGTSATIASSASSTSMAWTQTADFNGIIAFESQATAGGFSQRPQRQPFKKRQTPQRPPFTAAAGVAGQVQPQPTFPLPRRQPARALWRGGTGTRAPGGSTQPPPTLTPPRRKPSRVLWHGISGQPIAPGVTQPWPTIPVPRRKPSRAVVQFTPVTTTNQVITGVAVPPPVQLATFPRLRPQRAFIRFTPVTTTNLVVTPPPLTPPPVPRRTPARAFVRFTPVTTVNAGIPGRLQPWPTVTIPRRKPSRSVIEFTPVTTVNQAAARVAVPAPLMLARFPRKAPRRAFTAITFHPVRTVNAPAVAVAPALSPTGAGGSIEGDLWRMYREGNWPKRPPGFGPVGEVPSSGAAPPQPGERGWVGKKKRRFFWPKQEE